MLASYIALQLIFKRRLSKQSLYLLVEESKVGFFLSLGGQSVIRAKEQIGRKLMYCFKSIQNLTFIRFQGAKCILF